MTRQCLDSRWDHHGLGSGAIGVSGDGEQFLL